MKRISFLTLGTLFLTIAFVAVLATACGPKKAEIPKRSMPSGATFDGLWYSTFGDMTLTVREGKKVTGTSSHGTDGQLSGELKGGVVTFFWVQPGDSSIGRREVKGHGYFVMQADGKHIKGRWGYEDDYSAGGIWDADKATPDE